MRIFCARALAHLYCLFHWQYRVCYGSANNKIEWVGIWDGNQVKVITFPVWVVRKH